MTPSIASWLSWIGDNTAGHHQQHRGLLVQVAPGGQVMHQRPVEIGQTPEVELLKRLGGSELRAAQPHVELLALAPGDLAAYRAPGS